MIVKKRWTEMESVSLAKFEAELINNNFSGNINQELHGLMEGRTVESIKRRRKGAAHKKL